MKAATGSTNLSSMDRKQKSAPPGPFQILPVQSLDKAAQGIYGMNPTHTGAIPTG